MSINRDTMRSFFKDTLEELEALRERTTLEYEQADNVFANFESVAQDIDIPREKVLWTYLQKHLDGIKAHIKGHDSQREHVSGRIDDAILYLIILKAMVLENEGSLADTVSKSHTLNLSTGETTTKHEHFDVSNDINEPVDSRGRRIGKRASKKLRTNSIQRRKVNKRKK